MEALSDGVIAVIMTMMVLDFKVPRLVSLALYLIAVYLAFWRPGFALVVVALVTLIWIVPTLGVRHLTETEGRLD